jgi:hypothetical protein
MPKTVEEGYRTFCRRLTPTGGETEAAKRHRVSIETCLRKNFHLLGFFRSGSFGNGTSISRYSDVDYFAVINSEDLHENSNISLRKVKEVIDARFPFTNVRVNSPSIIVPFGTEAAETTEIVPANYLRTEGNKYRIYEIPDREGGWMKVSPDKHNSWVTQINDNLNKKVKPLIRFIKAWKYNRKVPISSFYLEMRISKFISGYDTIIYSIIVKNFFKHLCAIQLAAIQDPMGISGCIQACSTQAQKDSALSKLNTAQSRAKKARDAEVSGKISAAFYW